MNDHDPDAPQQRGWGEPTEISAPKALSSPKVAAVAGVIFAILFSIVIIEMQGTLQQDLLAGGFTGDHRQRLNIAVKVMPFAGIAFLWFIAVVRDGFGRIEDRFYSTVFLGSGLLFLAMMFVSAALASGLLMATAPGEAPLSGGLAHFGAAAAAAASKTFALRMSAVFMISLATIWWKTRLMPRWLAFVTYGSALALLVVSDLSIWVTLALPSWVLIVSAVMLLRVYRWRGSASGVAA